MPRSLVVRLTVLLGLLVYFGLGVAPRSPLVAAPQPAAVQVDDLSYWGMNAYFTKRDRITTKDNVSALLTSARKAGVRWTREELPWDLIEPNNGDLRGVYDASLRQVAGNGFGIIGMLLTTPGWARDGACRNNYWCPPADVNEYAQFAGWMAERYDADGINDAPGSPRIAAWNIWNEPNTTGTWPVVGGDETGRRRRYGELLVAAYNAIKAADSSALVLTGGVYVYDGSYCTADNCDGLNFLGGVFQQVPQARRAFDALAIHPYIPTERPDAPTIPRLITVEGRVRNARSWLNNGGRADAGLWITEMGWCTAPGTCPGGVQVSEEQQADYLIRSLVIAQQNGAQHASWLQLEDAFNDPEREWGNAAILRNYDGSGYPQKPAYAAYRTLAGQLATAQAVGTGPVHSHVYDPNQPYQGSGGTYDYRYARAGTTIDVLWRPTDRVQVAFPVIAGKPITVIDRNGNQTPLAPSGGVVQLTLSESPILVVQGEANPRLAVSATSITMLAEPGMATGSSIGITNNGGGILSWSASTATPWLTLGATGGVAPDALRVTANTQSFGPGRYTGAITVTSPDGGTLNIPVQLTVVTSLKRTYLPALQR